MVCRVRYLSSAGIHPREIPGIDRLAAAFPANWLLYTSLQCYPRNEPPIEIDAMVVMGDRVLLLEIKDWNGQLIQNGDQWLIGRRRQRSPVDSVAMKARKVKSFLKNNIPGFGNYYVDSRVVLTGSATKAALSPAEQPNVWSLQEAASIATPAGKAALLSRVTFQPRKAFQFEADFERLTRNSRMFGPLEAEWDGYRVIEDDFVVHPRKIWREHRAERIRDPRYRALLRVWAFDELPPGLNSPDKRLFIAEREMRAIGYLTEIGSKLIQENGILLPIGNDKDEILTQHFELRGVSPGWTTLDRFVAQTEDDLSPEDRVVMVSTLLNLFSELHSQGVYHRDIGPRSVWAGSLTRMSMTGLVSCQMPNEQSVSDWAPTLRGYAIGAPEDQDTTLSSTAAQRDVFALGMIAKLLLAPRTGSNGSSGATAQVLSNLESWVAKSIEPTPSKRYTNAREMADDYAREVERIVNKEIDQGLIDRHETDDNPYVIYPILSPLSQSPRCHVFIAANPPNTVVKIWLGLRRGVQASTDLALIRLFEGVSRLVSNPVEGLPRFVRASLSPVGPFVVYEHEKGETLATVFTVEASCFDGATALRFGIRLLQTVDALHGMGLAHGDLSDANVLVTQSGQDVLILDLFDISEVGDGRLRTHKYCPEGWENLTDQQIDRYAAISLAQELIRLTGDARLASAIANLQDELERPSIELLEPSLVALRTELGIITAPAIPTVRIRFPDGSPDYFKSDNGHYYVRAVMMRAELFEYTIAGLEREFIFNVFEGKVTDVRVHDLTFASLSHATRNGVPVSAHIVVEKGEDSGWEDLFGFIRPLVTPTTAQEDQVPETPTIDIPRYWRKLLEFEQNLLPEVEILKDVGPSSGPLALYAYERVSQNFDFDEGATVEVRFRGKRVGELDLDQTDGRVLAVESSSNRRLSVGDQVNLVERRARTSFDRRERAVERILDDEAAIPGLSTYFIPGLGMGADDLGIEVPDKLLDPYRLNAGQKAAFRHVARHGPVSLLQGPPGTGKTHFIAAFAHWLVSEAGARKVLIASQSNEAVNNVIEKLLDLLKATPGRRPSLLRIGSKGITARIRPYHTTSLRERYQSRFENAFKTRVTSLAAAAGIHRDVTEEAVEIDRQFGRWVRRLNALARAEASDVVNAEEQRRRDASTRSVVRSFKNAGLRILGRDVDETNPESELDSAFDALIVRHQASPADVAKARRLIELSQEWSESLASPHRNFEEFLAKTRSIVTATCVGVGQTKIRIDTQTFDWVIVDEAARCTPGELAVPIQVGRRVLLVGDQRQLLPMIERPVLKALSEEMPNVAVAEFVRSDFERAFLSPYGIANGQKLTEQYRMVEPICRLVSKVFYEPHVKLVTSPDRKGTTVFDGVGSPLHKPIIWIDTSAEPRHSDQSPDWNKHSFFNSAEVDAVMRLLERIADDSSLVAGLRAEPGASPIGVICMYSAQKIKIEQEFSRRAWDLTFRSLVRIDTVDSYQGKENTIVILSLVRSNTLHDQGHVRIPNRCNVALSRAKERVVIVGASKMWRKVPPAAPMHRILTEIDSSNSAEIVAAGDL